MIKKTLFCGMAVALTAMLFSCATSKSVWKDIDAAVERESFGDAVAAINAGQTEESPIYSEKDGVLLSLDRGVLEHYAVDYKASSEDLEKAQQLIKDAYTKSITQEIASYLANDNVKDYAGETYEDLYTNVFNALNYYNKGDVEGAGVEIRQVSDKIKFLGGAAAPVSGNGTLTIVKKAVPDLALLIDYLGETLTAAGLDSGIADAAPGLLKTVLTLAWELSQKGEPVTDSALARYLSAVVYRGINKPDDARIDLQSPVLANFPTADELNVPTGKARINVIGFAGLSPVKEQVILDLPLQLFPIIGSLQVVDAKNPKLRLTTGNLALPKLVQRPSAIDRVEVELNGSKVNLDLLEDIGPVMASTFYSDYEAVVTKTFFRALVKYVAVEAAGFGASPGGRMAQQAAVAGAKKGVDASEIADTRGARYFPGKAYAGGITVDPGKYTVTVNYYSGGTKIASEVKEINAAAGQANIVEAFCLK
jgi:hypothetical protein